MTYNTFISISLRGRKIYIKENIKKLRIEHDDDDERNKFVIFRVKIERK